MLNDRRIEERIESPDGYAKGEWEPSTAVDVRHMSGADVKAWVRAANKAAKAAGSYIRYRSLADDSGANW